MENRKRILIFAHYYAPDTASTGQILKDLAEGMLEEFDVTVICVVPSYDGMVAPRYRMQKYFFEELNGVKIVRIRVPEFTKSKKVSRFKNVMAYFFGALSVTRKLGRQDYVFTISQPPILGGLLGLFSKLQKRAKMIYCIHDFNPEQIMAISYSSNKIILKAAMFIDKFSCRYSDIIITVGRDMVETLKTRFKGGRVPKYTMINNWIDEKEVYPLPQNHERVQAFKKKYGLENKFVIMYSGNIGLYYDLENIIKVLKQFKNEDVLKVYEDDSKTIDKHKVVFAFVGAGSILDTLMLYVKKHQIENIIFIPYQDKKDLVYSLNAGDVHWCVNAKGIKGVSCPSKAYGIMGAGKPIIGVLEEKTEIRNLIEECNCGKCCEPGNYVGVADIIQWYIKHADSEEIKQMGKNGREYLEQNLTKDISIKKYIEVIKSL